MLVHKVSGNTDIFSDPLYTKCSLIANLDDGLNWQDLSKYNRTISTGSAVIPSGSVGTGYTEFGNTGYGLSVNLPSITGDFTIEVRAYTESLTSSSNYIFYGSGFYLRFPVIAGTNKLSVLAGGVGFNSVSTVGSRAAFFFAVTRENNTIRLYVNGVLDTTITGSNPIFGDTLYMGSSSSGSGDALLGYMHYVRITDGVARYTDSTYTLPQMPFTVY